VGLVQQAHPVKVTLVAMAEMHPEMLVEVVEVVQAQQVQMPHHLKAEMVV
jgi:hypothetical protein